MDESDARLVIEGDRAMILAVIGAVRLGSAAALKLESNLPAEQLTNESMSMVASSVVEQFTSQVSYEDVEREQVLIDVEDLSEVVSVDVEGF